MIMPEIGLDSCTRCGDYVSVCPAACGGGSGGGLSILRRPGGPSGGRLRGPTRWSTRRTQGPQGEGALRSPRLGEMGWRMNKLPDRGLGDVIKASRVYEPEEEKRRYERC
jgi:ferredoxin